MCRIHLCNHAWDPSTQTQRKAIPGYIVRVCLKKQS